MGRLGTLYRQAASRSAAHTKLYIKPLLPLIRDGLVTGLAHITGGGLTDNAPRMLPDGLEPEFDFDAWERPSVFKWLQETGGVAEAEMRRAFNCGIGMVLCVKLENMPNVLSRLEDAGDCLLYTSPSPRDQRGSRMPSSA